MSGEATTVFLSDYRTAEGENHASVTVVNHEELAAFLHGVYKISRKLANAYAHVVLAGAFVSIPVAKEQHVHLHRRNTDPAVLPLRHTVLHPSGLTEAARWAAEDAERDIRAYAEARRASVQGAK